MATKMHAGDIELAIAHRFGYRRYFIVPNISWGLWFMHELDMLVVSPANWATEVEIKISVSDLKADQKKRHDHYSTRIRYLYFAVPEDLQEKALALIPDRAGLIIVRHDVPGQKLPTSRKTEIVRSPKTNKAARKLNDLELKKLGKLAAMRIWTLKKAAYDRRRWLKPAGTQR